MAMTMTQKILAKHAGLDHVEAGQLIEAKLDVVMILQGQWHYQFLIKWQIKSLIKIKWF